MAGDTICVTLTETAQTPHAAATEEGNKQRELRVGIWLCSLVVRSPCNNTACVGELFCVTHLLGYEVSSNIFFVVVPIFCH